jgi:hypothetical protein
LLHSLVLTSDCWIATWQGQDPYNLDPLPVSPLLVALQEAIASNASNRQANR